MNCNFSVAALCCYGVQYEHSPIQCNGDDTAKQGCPIWAISAAIRPVLKTRAIEQRA
ncbi:hypothetical protein ANME2D_02359 [Candidatus Methanoperedens nitroreducens]|uniref:Uncharacterized protein n=1 Tax=Candidatus Methanoperedens nitratireducens TaxID=1392998 RepID=A0A062V769_9EURY|nr:hypothetical protein [Candidatus Methanoperedens nitroreducens]KCZ71624.1 hypothetical protein ANME2D_02359 [Candidatus Methanoperedens nitroreducens]MDJ1421254.1 hypothetical protein [Candidatus Methanoperedens sp.]